MAEALETTSKVRYFPAPYTPVFAESERTPAQRWHLVGSALAIDGSCYSVPAPGITTLHLRYIAGEIDTSQLLDEIKRQLRHPEAPAADVRPLPPERPGQVYPHAAEMVQLLHELAQLPPPQPYINVTGLPPQIEEAGRYNRHS